MPADDVWERVDVSDWRVYQVEQRGTSETRWLVEPLTDRRWLHKSTVIPSNGVEQGEDWSELVSTQVGRLLGVPCATTRICLLNERRGSISLDMRPDGYALTEGYVALTDAPGVHDYVRHAEGAPAHDTRRPDVVRPGHSLENIKKALREAGPPSTFDGPDGVTGFDVFTGYMIFDALVANTDRHEENWAVLSPSLVSMPDMVAPSYDHASSLGFNLTDRAREERLAAPERMRAWAENGRAKRFEHAHHAPTLVDHAAKALGLCSPVGAQWWCQQLVEIDLEPVFDALRDRRVPGMSDLAATFAHDLLDLNRRRLRDVIVRHA